MVSSPKIALALDISDEVALRKLVASLQPTPQVLKIGMEAVSGFGLERAIAWINELAPNCEIFLDLKLHDIPNTVARAVANYSKLDIDYLTVHALGGETMLSAAQDAAAGRVNLVAVTLLTSHAFGETTVGVPSGSVNSKQLSIELASLARRCGLRWVVCSGLECGTMKELLPDLSCVVPGIRLGDDQVQSDDQNRVVSPQQAILVGADMLVIGRPIYQSTDAPARWKSLQQEIYTSCTN